MSETRKRPVAKPKEVEAEDTAESSQTVEEKIEVAKSALDSKLEDDQPDSPHRGEPDGVILSGDDEIKVDTEDNDYGQKVATSDVWLKRIADGSIRPTYFQVAVKGVPVTPYFGR